MGGGRIKEEREGKVGKEDESSHKSAQRFQAYTPNRHAQVKANEAETRTWKKARKRRRERDSESERERESEMEEC